MVLTYETKLLKQRTPQDIISYFCKIYYFMSVPEINLYFSPTFQDQNN